MPPLSIVKRFDVLKNQALCSSLILEHRPVDQFAFQCCED